MSDLKKLWLAQNKLKEHATVKKQAEQNEMLPKLRTSKARFEEHMRSYRRLQASYKDLSKRVKQREMDCSGLSESIEKLKHQLYDSEYNNPKELQSIEQKLDQTKQELRECEDLVLEVGQEHEETTKKLQEMRLELQKEKAIYQKNLSDYEKWKSGIKRKLLKLKKEAKKLMADVDPEVMKLYQHKSARLGNNVVAQLKDNSCGGCRVDIPPVVLKEMKLAKRPLCENCGRLLLC